jgi:hypothetical protein
LGTTLTNQNLIQEKIKRGLNSSNACYHSVQNILSFSLLSENVTIIIYKTIILPLVLYGRKTWYLTLREGHRLRAFGKRVLRIFGMKSGEVIEGRGKLQNEDLHSLYFSSSVIGMIMSKRACSTHVGF